MKEQAMISKDTREIEATSASGYPEPFRSQVLPREVRRLGDAFGLSRLGVNHVTLFPGKVSSMRHHHSKEDELIYILEGELVLRTDHGEELLKAGMVAGFPAGDGNGHQLVNRSGDNAVYLVMSNRHPDDAATYPDDDLAVTKVDGQYVFSTKSGQAFARVEPTKSASPAKAGEATFERNYEATVTWTGNTGSGTRTYTSYERSHVVSGAGKPDILCSSSAVFRGDPKRYSPDDLLIAALAACHMLWYLHLASDAGLVVVSYQDNASGTLRETTSSGGKFSHAQLRPRICLAAGNDSDLARARALHTEAHRLCFIANSVNFPVACEPEITVAAV
jgi:uncharacterized cupin superfamily protein/organic hydroperoxide reductase OsmC/OhrA